MDFAVEKCLELISENNITFKGIDFNEVGLYLALTTKKKDLEKEGLLDFCPTRCMSGRPPTVTSSGKNKDYEKRWKNWQRPLRKATDEMNKKLLMKAFEVALKLVMKNHIFTFNDENFKQLSGGAIGVSIAGDVANLFMVWWDRELKVRLNEARIQIELYSRYVDDGNTAIQRPEDLRDCPNDEAEKETMERVKAIANLIHQSIQVKVDYPSNHEDERMPILDTKMWIGEVEVRGKMRHQILYTYYEKAMSSKHVLHKESAISRGSKINILVNELLRVMRNTSLRVQQEEKDKHVQHFINKMQFSGYNQEDRVLVYQKAKRKFEEKIRGKEVYPHVDKATRMRESTRERVQKKREWFKQGKYKGVFYVDATPGGSLARECQKVLDRCGIPIKTMEKTGDSIKKLLTKSNPFKPNNCGDPSCPVCTRDCKINCRSNDVVYQNYCVHRESCGGEYDGETSDVIRDRFKEHLDDARLRPETSYMQKHIEEHHNGEQVEFKVRILGSCPGDAMLRQCMEAVVIRDENPSMNSRAEWGTRRGRQRREEPDDNERSIREQTNNRTTGGDDEAPTGETNRDAMNNNETAEDNTGARRPIERTRNHRTETAEDNNEAPTRRTNTGTTSNNNITEGRTRTRRPGESTQNHHIATTEDDNETPARETNIDTANNTRTSARTTTRRPTNRSRTRVTTTEERTRNHRNRSAEDNNDAPRVVTIVNTPNNTSASARTTTKRAANRTKTSATTTSITTSEERTQNNRNRYAGEDKDAPTTVTIVNTRKNAKTTTRRPANRSRTSATTKSAGNAENGAGTDTGEQNGRKTPEKRPESAENDVMTSVRGSDRDDLTSIRPESAENDVMTSVRDSNRDDLTS